MVNSTTVSTLTGVLLVIIVNISYDELLKTAILAAIGGVVSFGISKLLKRLTDNRRRGERE
jgi:hypothetical protein